MSRVYLNDSTLIAKAMKDHLNSWSKKPVPFLPLFSIGSNYHRRFYRISSKSTMNCSQL